MANSQQIQLVNMELSLFNFALIQLQKYYTYILSNLQKQISDLNKILDTKNN